MNATLGQLNWENLFFRLKFSKMQPNAHLAWQNFIMQKVGVTMMMGKLCLAINFDDMKECDAPKSNKIVAGCEFARNKPNTTSCDCWASSTVIWLTLP
jgi:hypothetical protein